MNALAIHLYLTIRHINLSFNYFGNFYRIIVNNRLLLFINRSDNHLSRFTALDHYVNTGFEVLNSRITHATGHSAAID